MLFSHTHFLLWLSLSLSHIKPPFPQRLTDSLSLQFTLPISSAPCHPPQIPAHLLLPLRRQSRWTRPQLRSVRLPPLCTVLLWRNGEVLLHCGVLSRGRRHAYSESAHGVTDPDRSIPASDVSVFVPFRVWVAGGRRHQVGCASLYEHPHRKGGVREDDRECEHSHFIYKNEHFDGDWDLPHSREIRTIKKQYTNEILSVHPKILSLSQLIKHQLLPFRLRNSSLHLDVTVHSSISTKSAKLSERWETLDCDALCGSAEKSREENHIIYSKSKWKRNLTWQRDVFFCNNDGDAEALCLFTRKNKE